MLSIVAVADGTSVSVDEGEPVGETVSVERFWDKVIETGVMVSLPGGGFVQLTRKRIPRSRKVFILFLSMCLYQPLTRLIIS